MEEKQISVVEQIHNEFDFASEAVLLEARIILDDAQNKDLSRGRVLSALGFTNTVGAKIFNEEKQKIELLQKQMQLVLKYKEMFPSNNFIFRDMVQEICKKYGLVCAEAKCYKGDIPDSNITEIEAFEKIRKSIRLDMWSVGVSTRWIGEEHNDGGAQAREYPTLFKTEGRLNDKGKETPSYMICAPFNEMDLGRTEKLGDKYIYDKEKPAPDPIVLCPIPEGYLIVTKWGNEENIEELKQ